MTEPQHKFSIGRERSCDIALVHESVSRRHAELAFIDAGRLLLTDCGSANGTFLIQGDGSRKAVHQELISPMDQVRFGDVQLSVRDLVEAIRVKFPSFQTAHPEPEPSRKRPEMPQGPRLVRCECGSIKPADGICPECGR